MKFSDDKKDAIRKYILEQIDAKTSGLSRKISETFEISRNTVNNYLLELIEAHQISKTGRDQYALETTETRFELIRENGELQDENDIFEEYIAPQIRNCSESAQRIWNYAVSEMINNVIDHSGAERLFLVIQQNSLYTTVILVDDGIGIFNKIREHFGLQTLEDARCELFKGRVTTDASRHSGEGIFFTSKMMDKFFILSSEKCFATDRFTAYLQSVTLPEDADFHQKIRKVGTLVAMRLSNFSEKRITDVFNQYSTVDEGFIRTQIPIRLFFENAPVARSQARRLCSGLDKFSEIIFDFEDVSFMGQGFAHQVFSVFQHEHPEITLTPVNMQPDVAAMYQHTIHTK